MSSEIQSIFDLLIPQAVPNFEEIVNNQSPALLERQCRNMYISQEDADRVKNNKGEHCCPVITGSGYSNWYFYHTMDDRLVFVIKIWNSNQQDENWSCTWQYGVVDDIDVETDDIPQGHPQLIRSCTRFDCHCPEQGIRACSTYNTCTGCYKEFEHCRCD
jgi:hypothetical protein